MSTEISEIELEDTDITVTATGKQSDLWSCGYHAIGCVLGSETKVDADRRKLIRAEMKEGSAIRGPNGSSGTGTAVERLERISKTALFLACRYEGAGTILIA